jgi:hypothetical protein
VNLERHEITRRQPERLLPQAAREDIHIAIEQFSGAVDGVRLVRNVSTGTIDGVATWDPHRGRITRRVETPAQHFYRAASLKLLTDLPIQMLGQAFAPPTGPDEAMTITAEAVDPLSIGPKLCGMAVEAVMDAHGAGPFATLIGRVVQDLVTPLLTPTDQGAKAKPVLQVIDVTADAAGDRLTGEVFTIAAGHIDSEILKRSGGISRADLEKIESAICSGQIPSRTVSTR